MWWLWLAATVTCACAQLQQTDTRVTNGGSTYEWGWQEQKQPEGPTTGQYYVRLPQSEQRVRYTADKSGYHGAVATNASDGQRSHSASFALGQRAFDLRSQEPPQSYQTSPKPNTTQLYSESNKAQSQSTPPVEIFLLPQQYQAPGNQDELIQVQPTAIPGNLLQYSTPFYYITNNGLLPSLYSVQYNQPNQNRQNAEPSAEPTKMYQNEEVKDQEHEFLTTSVVKVFKNHNCSKDGSSSDTVAKESINVALAQKQNKLQKELKIAGDLRNAQETKFPLNYRGAVHFKVESPRENARSERYYYTTVSPIVNKDNINREEGISRLVESTQDLISNEDLLKINHAAEKQIHIHSEDLIKPRPKYSSKSGYTKQYVHDAPRSRITVKAKIGKIVDSEVQHIDHHESKTANSNEYRFVTPIVVQDPTANNYREQIMNNIVSTMVPYIEDGYEIVSVRNALENKQEDQDGKKNHDVTVDVTPRPIGQKYLAPITVALRLLNANDSETLNRVDDHETSDSEPIPETVQKPKEKTIVEIQESIPVSITHINDVEVHEYLDEGRSNGKGTLNIAQSLYKKYVDALESSRKIQKNMNNALYKYHTINNSDNNREVNNYKDENDARDNLVPSENRQSNVHVSPNEDGSSERSELVNIYSDYADENNQQLIQPIIIEKEVPITKFVDRFIEKQVPYPEPVQIYKAFPVDRPVPYPVPYEKIVEKPVEVTRFVDKPYPVEFHHAYPVEVKVPYPVEHKVYIDRPIHVPYPVEKVIEKQVVQQIPVPTPVAVPVEVQVPVEQQVLYPIPIETPVPIPVEVEKPVPVEKIVHKEVPVPYAVEKRVPYPVHYETKVPVPYPVEKRVPVTVEKIVEKPVTVTKVVEKPVHIQVPVPHPVPVAVRVPEPYPVDRIVEKKVPYPVHVDRIVEKKVKVPYPVQTVVEKIVEKPVVVTKYVDKPYPVEKRVPYPVEKIVEKKVPFPVQVPIEVKVPYPVERIVEKPVHIPVKIPYQLDKIIEKPLQIYNYGYNGAQQTQNVLQHVKHVADQQRQSSNQQRHQQLNYANAQLLKERQRTPVQTTHWGNQYASSYQYVNASQQPSDFKRSIVDYLSHLNRPAEGYYGPVPLQKYEDWWEKNRDYVVEMKVKRTDRTPKVTKLRIEYGGFKPPLIPSTEVDLDGIPVKKDDQVS